MRRISFIDLKKHKVQTKRGKKAIEEEISNEIWLQNRYHKIVSSIVDIGFTNIFDNFLQ